MSCRRICRELLWLTRFGDFGPSSQPHLDHLAGCRGCRDEVGFDRALVEQLRVALAARIENGNPPSGAWERILARAQTPEPAPAGRLRRWATVLAGRQRFGTAMAGTGLALLLALNTEIVPVSAPAFSDAELEVGRSTLQQAPPRVRADHLPLERPGADEGAAEPRATPRADPNLPFAAVSRAQAELQAASRRPPEEPVGVTASTDLRVVIGSIQAAEPVPADDGEPIEPEGQRWEPLPSEPGAPS